MIKTHICRKPRTHVLPTRRPALVVTSYLRHAKTHTDTALMPQKQTRDAPLMPLQYIRDAALMPLKHIRDILRHAKIPRYALRHVQIPNHSSRTSDVFL